MIRIRKVLLEKWREEEISRNKIMKKDSGKWRDQKSIKEMKMNQNNLKK